MMYMSRMYTGTASKCCFLAHVSSEMALEGRWVKDLNRNYTLKAHGLVQARLVHRRGAKAWLIILSRVCLPALQRFTLMNISAELMWRRGILGALLCVGTLALEYYSAKRLLSACDAIIERLKMKDE